MSLEGVVLNEIAREDWGNKLRAIIACLPPCVPDSVCSAPSSQAGRVATVVMARAVESINSAVFGKIPLATIARDAMEQRVCATVSNEREMKMCKAAVEDGENPAFANAAIPDVVRNQHLLQEMYTVPRSSLIPVYRGISVSQWVILHQALKKNIGATLGLRPVSSWTLSYHVAFEFAGKGGAIIQQMVPIRDIAFSGLTTHSTKCVYAPEAEVGVYFAEEPIITLDDVVWQGQREE